MHVRAGGVVVAVSRRHPRRHLRDGHPANRRWALERPGAHRGVVRLDVLELGGGEAHRPRRAAVAHARLARESAVAPRQIGERPPFLGVTDARPRVRRAAQNHRLARVPLVPGERARQVREPRLRPRRLRPVDLGHRADDAHQPRQARRAPLGNERVDVGRDGVEDARRDRLEAREQRRVVRNLEAVTRERRGRAPGGGRLGVILERADVGRFADRSRDRAGSAPRVRGVSGSGRPPETSARRPRARLRDADTHVPSASPTGDARRHARSTQCAPAFARESKSPSKC